MREINKMNWASVAKLIKEQSFAYLVASLMTIGAYVFIPIEDYIKNEAIISELFYIKIVLSIVIWGILGFVLQKAFNFCWIFMTFLYENIKKKWVKIFLSDQEKLLLEYFKGNHKDNIGIVAGSEEDIIAQKLSSKNIFLASNTNIYSPSIPRQNKWFLTSFGEIILNELGYRNSKIRCFQIETFQKGILNEK